MALVTNSVQESHIKLLHFLPSVVGVDRNVYSQGNGDVPRLSVYLIPRLFIEREFSCSGRRPELGRET